MGCKIAENQPLQQLRKDLGLPFQCHSLRDHCRQGADRRLGSRTMGGAGAAIGYCQALFNHAGTSGAHTDAVLKALEEAGAPWARSHELYWGYRHDETAADFFCNALKPLMGNGRIPVVISSLDPAIDLEEIKEIIATHPPIFPGESILLRLVLKSEESIKAAANLLISLVLAASRSGTMPVWWPLFQASFNSEVWSRLSSALGENWRYVNIAVNPFVDERTIAKLAEQITVAQFVVGLSEHIHLNGDIEIPENMTIHGALPGAAYNVINYASTLQRTNILPTCILLGPSQENWTIEQNINRITRFLSVFQDAANILWQPIDPRNRELVWSMAA